jgi:hypothetical protein
VALSDAYATAAEYRALTDRSSTADDSTIGRDLLAVSRYIDKVLGRTLGFKKDSSDVARTYAMLAGTQLAIDDHVSVTSVEKETSLGVYTAISGSSYVLRPRNAATAPEQRPYWVIEFLSDIPRPGQLVRVTGIGGWPSTPGAITVATIELTALLRMESPRATNRVTEVNQVLSTSRPAQNILEGLLRVYQAPGVFA